MNLRFLGVAATALIAGGCSTPNSRLATRLNREAALVGDLASSPLHLKVITLEADSRESTISTLFGNDIALEYCRMHAGRDYPIGAELSFATWQLREDPRWFGGNIPSQPSSVEVVLVQAADSGRPSYTYRAYQGSPLEEVLSAESAASARITLLLSKRAAVMP